MGDRVAPAADDIEVLWARRRAATADASEALVAAATARAAGDELNEARALVVAATHHLQRGDGDEALRVLTTAGRTLQAAGDHRWSARCLDRQMIVLFHQGRYRDALEMGLTATRHAREGGDLETEAISLANVGRLWRVMGDPDRSLVSLRRGLRLARQVGNDALVAHLLAEIGDLLVDRGDFDDAEHYLQEAEQAAGEGEPRLERIVVGLARSRVALAKGEPERAGRAADDAHEVASAFGDHLWIGTSLRQLADVAAATADPDAIARYEQAIDALRRHGYAQQLALALIGLARVHADRGEAEPAIARLEEASSVAWQQPGVGAEAHTVLARIHEDRGDPATALHHLRRSIELGEQHRREESDRRIDALRVHLEVEESEREAATATARSEELAHALAELQRVNDLLAASNEERQRLIEQLHRLADEDALTGLANRRQFERRLEEEVVHARRLGRPLAVAMVDVDRFKAVNDVHTHVVGDVVLEEVGARLHDAVRDSDLVARWGGEEFAVLLVGATSAAARAVCDRARAAIADHPWDAIAPGLAVTVSIGIASDHPNAPVDDVLRRADENLFRAKEAGRDRVITEGF